MRHPRSHRKCPGEPESRPHSTRGSLQLEKECRGAGPYPGDDELPGVLVVGINPLPQQGDEAHQVELVALCHDVLWVKGMRAACWGRGCLTWLNPRPGLAPGVRRTQRKMTEPESGRRGPRSIPPHTGRRTSRKDALKAGIKVERTNQKAKPCISVVWLECPGELSINCPCHWGQGGVSMRGH